MRFFYALRPYDHAGAANRDCDRRNSPGIAHRVRRSRYGLRTAPGAHPIPRIDAAAPQTAMDTGQLVWHIGRLVSIKPKRHLASKNLAKAALTEAAMHSWRFWAIQATLVAGVAAGAAGGAERSRSPRPPTDEAASSWDWLNPLRWFETKKSEPAAEARRENKGKKEPPGKVEPAPLSSPVDEARIRRQREETALWRRLEVCDRLREMAMQTDDEDLLRQADDLAERAFSVYRQRTAGLSSGATAEALADADPLQALDKKGRRTGDKVSQRPAQKEIAR